MNRRRTLNEELNALPDEPSNRERLNDVVVRLRFSRPVVSPDVALGATLLTASERDPAPQRDWVLSASRVGISSADREAGRLGLSVLAMDSDGAILDGRPATPVALRPDGTGWRGYEAGGEPLRVGTGGDDRTHWITLAASVDTAVEPFAPYRLFTFQDAAKVAPGLRHYSVRGGEEAASWYIGSGAGHEIRADGLGEKTAPETVSSGRYRVPGFEAVVETQGARFIVNWNNWGSGAPSGLLIADIFIASYPVSTASLRAAIAYSIETGMEAVSIEGYEAASRLPETFASDRRLVLYNAVAGNSIVSVQVRQTINQNVGYAADFPQEPSVVAEGILQVIAERLSNGGPDAEPSANDARVFPDGVWVRISGALSSLEINEYRSLCRGSPPTGGKVTRGSEKLHGGSSASRAGGTSASLTRLVPMPEPIIRQ